MYCLHNCINPPSKRMLKLDPEIDKTDDSLSIYGTKSSSSNVGGWWVVGEKVENPHMYLKAKSCSISPSNRPDPASPASSRG